MGGKREVPPVLRRLMDWDVKITNNVLAAVIKRAGPMRNYGTILKGLEISCNGWVWLGSCTASMFFSGNIYMRHLVVNLLIALIFDIIVVAVIKAAVRRRRPVPVTSDFIMKYTMDKYSFPSGHATRAAMVATLCSVQYDLGLLLELPLYTWFVGVCGCRLLLRRHHLLDIVCGIVIGWLQALLLMLTGFWLSLDSANTLVAYFLDETYVGASYDV